MRTLRRTDFAWEFLRRNERYRRAAEADASGREVSPGRWGLQFFADPSEADSRTSVFWRPEAAPNHVIRLRPSDCGAGFRLEDVVEILAQRREPGGVHLKLSGGLQAFIEGGEQHGSLAVIVPLSGTFSAALKGVAELERVIRGGAPCDDLTAQQQRRLQRALRALDGAQNRATYRQIATEIFGQEAVDRYDWRTSSVRDAAIRLVRTGRGLSNGGYIGLLGGVVARSRLGPG